MKIYLVGGAVRDKLLGFPIKERDWVVVGATVDDMLNLGYRQVGKEFPVFLHPDTREEYALARIEHKVKPGYQGFTFDTSPDVALEDDLKRRDLTINAMAETLEAKLIDPYHGKQDLENKILRHVSEAFTEDPVRILRVGRFLARYAYLGFDVANETLALMRQMVTAGEANALVAERVWKELERALSEKNPEKFFTVLEKCNALSLLFPHLSMDNPGMHALKTASTLSSEPSIRFAALLHTHSKQNINDLCDRYRIPNAYRELTLLTAAHYETACKASHLSAEEWLHLFSALDIFRREERYKKFLVATEAIAISCQLNFHSTLLLTCAMAAKTVNVQALIAQGFTGQPLAEKINEKRLENIASCLKQ